MAPELERSIDRLRLRALQGAFLGTSLRWFAVAAAVLAGVALLLRVAFGFGRAEAAWAFAPLVLVPVVALVAAKKRMPSRAGTVAWLDVRTGGTGAVVGAWETPDARWTAPLQRALADEPAQPRFDVARPARVSLASVAFAALVLCVPIAPALVGPPIEVQQATLERIEEQLAALQEQVDLEPEVAAELHEALERLRREGALAEPEGAFEALDRAQEKLAQEAYERAEQAQSAQDDLASAADEAAANAEAAQEKLERTLGQLAQAGFSRDIQSALERELGAAGVSLPPGTKLDAGQITAISKELADKLGLRAGELGKSGLLDARALAKLGELAKLDGFEFDDHVCDESCEKQPCAKCAGAGHGVCLAHGAKPGRGGVDRGRADAEMTWGEETAGDTSRFEAKTLPDARFADPEHSGIVGIGATAPPVDPMAEAPGSGAIEASGGQTAWRRRLAPHHRDAVRSWFGPGGR